MDLKTLAIVRHYFAQSVFTHTVQEVATIRNEKRAKRYKWTHIGIAFVVLSLLAVQAFNLDSPIFAIIGAGVTVGEITFSLVQLNFDPERMAITHKSSALKYLELRDKYMLLIADIMGGSANRKEIVLRRNTLQQEYQYVSSLAPQTGSEDYTEAQERLNKRGAVSGEEFTWSDDEINHFLPKELRYKF
jgi:hypothetical protein